jgi:hypothetical protein
MDDRRSETGSIETDADRDTILDVLADGTRVPEWAPAFADAALPDGARWRGTKGDRAFAFRVAVEREAGTVDYLREIAPGTENGAYLRVVPRLGGGSVIAMTLPVRPGTDAAEVRDTLTAELARIAALVA